MPEEVIDVTARREVSEVRHDLRNHKMVSELVVKGVDKKIDTLISLLKWVGTLIVTSVLGVLAWSLVQQWNANEAQRQNIEEQVRLIQAQTQHPPVSIPATAPEPSATPERGR
jgi:cytoskeletal protein RodZ